MGEHSLFNPGPYNQRQAIRIPILSVIFVELYISERKFGPEGWGRGRENAILGLLSA